MSLLNINTWDALVPVALPLGQKTMPAIVPASMGVLVPFALFALCLFRHLYGGWAASLDDAADDDGNDGAAAARVRFAAGGSRELTTIAAFIDSGGGASRIRW